MVKLDHHNPPKLEREEPDPASLLASDSGETLARRHKAPPRQPRRRRCRRPRRGGGGPFLQRVAGRARGGRGCLAELVLASMAAAWRRTPWRGLRRLAAELVLLRWWTGWPSRPPPRSSRSGSGSGRGEATALHGGPRRPEWRGGRCCPSGGGGWPPPPRSNHLGLRSVELRPLPWWRSKAPLLRRQRALS